MPGVAWQRCQVHLQRDASSHVPKVDMRPGVAQDLREDFHASDRIEAEHKLKQLVTKYKKRAPKLASRMQENIAQGLTVLALPAAHRRNLKSTNMLENLNKQIKRRTAVAGLFANEGALMRLVTAILVEQERGMGDWKDLHEDGELVGHAGFKTVYRMGVAPFELLVTFLGAGCSFDSVVVKSEIP